jgi:penicillin-binding protein A
MTLSATRAPRRAFGIRRRTAAGFWNSTLSPLHAAWLSATVARGGEPVRPYIVAEVEDERGRASWTSPGPLALKRAMSVETAQAITTMMESTVSDGTSYKAFHDGRGEAFLPGIGVAGKTGTLTDHASQRFYTWFTGFAPSHPYAVTEGSADAPPRQVAIGVLVVNQPTWNVKANVLAREVLRAYFAQCKAPGVSAPTLSGVQSAARGTRTSPEVSTTPGTKHRRHRGS